MHFLFFFLLDWKISKIFPKKPPKKKILERQRKILKTPMVLHSMDRSPWVYMT